MTHPITRLTFVLLLLAATACRAGDPASSPASATIPQIDVDLLDVTVPRLQELYATKRYTVRQVVAWHLARIDRYNGVYGAIETVLRDQALAEATRLDSLAAAGRVTKGPLWGVPIVIKANTSVAGEITTAGWAGFTKPGHELVAPRDATIVGKFRAVALPASARCARGGQARGRGQAVRGNLGAGARARRARGAQRQTRHAVSEPPLGRRFPHLAPTDPRRRTRPHLSL